MGIPGSANFLLAGGGAQAYQIEQSLRFSGDEFIRRSNPTNTATSRKTFTHSFWVKRGSLGSTQQLAHWVQGGVAQQTFICFDSSDRINVFYEGSAGAAVGHSYSTARYRDASAWYHIVWATDTTQAVSTNRWKVWVNGEQITTWDSVAYPSQDLILPTNDTGRGFAHGTRVGNEDQLLSGYIAESYFVDGQFLDHEDFGEYDDNGVWRPIAYSGTYGVRGWYLPFDVADIYSDESGNNQDFEPITGYTHETSGTGTDVMSDTPTTNWCTLNPLDFADVTAIPTISEGMLRSSGLSARSFGTIAIPSSGKYYFEGQATTVGYSTAMFGIYAAHWGSNGYVTAFDSAVTLANFASYSNEMLGIAVNVDDGEITFYKNNTSVGTLSVSNMVGTLPFFNHAGNWTWTVNFGQRAFAYTPPTGYKALNTANLPAPDIADGSQYFNTVLYSGNGASSQAITGVGFSPDFVWIKNRGAGNNGMLQDVVRGANVALNSAYSNTESINSGNGHVDSFNSDGFTVGWDGANNGGDTNASGNSYVAWSWDAGGSGSSNTSGSITSTVSANPTAGFSIVGYTAQSAVRTIGHGLGVAPDLIITKNREASQQWAVYHSSLGATKAMILDTAVKQETNSSFWNNAEPTSTVFTVGTNTRTGGTNDDYIAYCFAEVEGYSKVGTYTGNGSSSDGPCIHLGFRPAMILLKNYANGSETSWILMDSVRDKYNVAHEAHRPNEPDQDVTSSNPNTDFLSNGFKLRTSWADMNENNSLYLYFAIAENPFGGDGVSPATAR